MRAIIATTTLSVLLFLVSTGVINAQYIRLSQEDCEDPCSFVAIVLGICPNDTTTTIIWSDGQVGTTADSLCAGVTVNVAITACGHCVYLNVTPQLLSVTATQKCDEVRVATTGGTPFYQYEWNDGSNHGNRTLPVGTHTVTVTDASGCTASDTITVVPFSLTANVTTTNATCGEPTGAATVTPAGTGAPFTYKWNTGATTQSISNLSAGMYTATVTDAEGCNTTATGVIQNVGQPTDTTISMSACESVILPNGQVISSSSDTQIVYQSANGCDSTVVYHVEITNTGGSYDHYLSGCGSVQLENGEFVFSDSTWTEFVATVNGCVDTVFWTTNVFEIQTVQHIIHACGPFEYNGIPITADTTFFQTVASEPCDVYEEITVIFSVPVATVWDTLLTCDYSILPGEHWTQGDNCQVADSVLVVIHEPKGILVEVRDTTCISSNQDSWFVMTATCAPDTLFTTVYEPLETQVLGVPTCDSELIGSWWITNETTGEGCPFLQVNIAQYTIVQYSTVEATTCIPAQAGIVRDTLQNAMGCDSLTTTTTTVFEPAFDVVISTDTCVEGVVPYISLEEFEGCYGNVHYVFNFVKSRKDTTIWSCNGPLGDLQYDETDEDGCVTEVTIHRLNYLASTSYTSMQICSGGFPVFWNGQIVSGEGDYFAILISANGCDSIANLTVYELPAVVSTETVQVCGSELPFNWNSLTVSEAGEYTVNLQNTNGCDSIANLTVYVIDFYRDTTIIGATEFICGDSTGFQTIDSVVIINCVRYSFVHNVEILPSPTVSLGSTQPDCSQNMGSIWFEEHPQDVDIFWDTTEPIVMPTNGDTILIPSGTYIVTAMDANGCEASDTIVINEPPQPISVSLETIWNCPDTLGQVSSLVSGGTGNYSYNWNGSWGEFSSANIDSARAGFYAVTVTDDNGCVATANALLKEPICPIECEVELFREDENTIRVVIRPEGGGTVERVEWTSWIASQGDRFSVQSGTEFSFEFFVQIPDLQIQDQKFIIYIPLVIVDGKEYFAETRNGATAFCILL